MLGQADTGYNLLIGNPIYVTNFYGCDKLCNEWVQRVEGSSFTRPSTDLTKPSILLGVDGDILSTNFAGINWERGTLGGKKGCYSNMCFHKVLSMLVTGSSSSLALVAEAVLALRLDAWH